jgi:hypothetical protein
LSCRDYPTILLAGQGRDCDQVECLEKEPGRRLREARRDGLARIRSEHTAPVSFLLKSV